MSKVKGSLASTSPNTGSSLVRVGRGGGPWTDVRDGPLGWTFETNGIASHADCFRSLSERAVGAGRGRTSVTGRWDGLLKRMA